MQSLFIAAIGSLTITLRFDGSLRPPRDPTPGFTYSSSVSVNDSTTQLDGSEKLASCSAAISLHSPNDTNGHEEEKLIAIGGRYLPNAPGMNAADTEYDGLLLGLEWLVHIFSSEEENGSNIIPVLNKWNDVSNDEYQLLDDPPKLIIRGDCKTVIDQLTSRSVPRKMETKYNLAMDRIKSLKDMYAAEHQQRTMCENLDTADVSVSHELSLCFEHVPRGKNHFCDALCKLVINQKQSEIVESIHDLIRLGEDDASKNTDSHMKNRHIKKSKRNRISHPKSDYFQQAMNKIHDTPQLCQSSRLALACKLTQASIRQKDAVVLSEMSAFFLQMSRRWSRMYYLGNARDSVDKDTLRNVSIACEKLSKYFAGHVLDAPFVADNRDLCCSGIASVFEFCTGNKSNYNDGDLDSMHNAILMPYVDISEMIRGVEVEFWRNELLNWNMVVSEDQKKVSVKPRVDSLAVWTEML